MSTKQFMIALSFLWLIVSGVEAQTINTIAIETYLADQIEAHGFVGIGFVVVQDEEVIYAGGVGEDGRGNPITAQTQFYIGSVSKSFTALAIMQLVDRGLIELDAPVQRYLPSFRVTDEVVSRQITVRHLLNQVSGLSDASLPLSLTDIGTDLEALVVQLAQARPTSEVGTMFAYFNLNYAVLGRVVEVVSGQDFDTYLTENILTPLGMLNSTTANRLSDDSMQLALGHVVAWSIPIALPEQYELPTSLGGIISTPRDMGSYMAMYNADGRFGGVQVVSSRNVGLMQTPLELPTNGGMSYGMGWYREAMAMDVIKHAGDISSYHTDMVRLPDRDLAFVLMYNSNNLLQNMLIYGQIQSGVIALLNNQALPEAELPYRVIGIGIGIVMLVSILGDVRSLWGLGKWGQANKQSVMALLVRLIADLVIVGLFLALPSLLLMLMGRYVSYEMMLLSLPDITLWIMISVMLALIKVVVRLVMWLRAHGEPITIESQDDVSIAL